MGSLYQLAVTNRIPELYEQINHPSTPVNSSDDLNRTALLGACRRGDDALFQDLLSLGADPNFPEYLLQELIRCGCAVETFQASVAAGANIHRPTLLVGDRPTPSRFLHEINLSLLDFATLHGRLDIAEALVVFASYRSHVHPRALFWAVKHRASLPFLKLLALRNPHQSPQEALLEAVRTSQADVFLLLVQNFPPESFSRRAVFSAIARSGDLALLDAVGCLICTGIPQSFGFVKRSPITPMIQAARYRQLHVVRYLEAQGHHLFPEHCAYGVSPFNWAVRNNDCEMVQLFLSHEVQWIHVFLAVFAAIRYHALDVLKLLLQIVDRKKQEERIPHPRFPSFACLVSRKGEWICFPPGYGSSPAELAAFYGHREMFQFLLAYGFDPACAIATATINGRKDMVVDLLERGFNPNTAFHGWTPLLIAIELQRYDILQVLLTNPAVDVNQNAIPVPLSLCSEFRWRSRRYQPSDESVVLIPRDHSGGVPEGQLICAFDLVLANADHKCFEILLPWHQINVSNLPKAFQKGDAKFIQLALDNLSMSPDTRLIMECLTQLVRAPSNTSLLTHLPFLLENSGFGSHECLSETHAILNSVLCDRQDEIVILFSAMLDFLHTRALIVNLSPYFLVVLGRSDICQRGISLPLVSLLLKHGADPNDSSLSEHPLMQAFRFTAYFGDWDDGSPILQHVVDAHTKVIDMLMASSQLPIKGRFQHVGNPWTIQMFQSIEDCPTAYMHAIAISRSGALLSAACDRFDGFLDKKTLSYIASDHWNSYELRCTANDIYVRQHHLRFKSLTERCADVLSDAALTMLPPAILRSYSGVIFQPVDVTSDHTLEEGIYRFVQQPSPQLLMRVGESHFVQLPTPAQITGFAVVSGTDRFDHPNGESSDPTLRCHSLNCTLSSRTAAPSYCVC